MPRLQLAALDSYPFSTLLTVRTTDLNYGGHLANDRLLALLHEARVAFLATHDWSEMDCAGASLIMSDAALVYKSECYAGDALSIEVAIAEPSRCGFRMHYRVTRTADAALVTLAETGLACFDYGARKLATLPEAVAVLCRGA